MNSREYQEIQKAYFEVYQEETKEQDPFGRPGGKHGGVPKEGSGYSRAIQANKTALEKLDKKNQQKEEVDLHDAILSHLLDEGYADTLEAAEGIMVSMSEEWREEIVEKADNTIRLVYGKGGKGVPIEGGGNVLRKPNVGFDKQGAQFRADTTDAANRASSRQRATRDSQAAVGKGLTDLRKKSINRLNAAKNIEDRQADGDYENPIDHSNPSRGKSGYMQVPTDHPARKGRASGR